MKSIKVPIIGAVVTALLSTLCCLPAFLFLFFGISSGVLSYFTTFEYTRIPLALLTIGLFIFAFININKKISCKCSKKEIYKQYFLFALFFITLLGLLFYPEFLTLFLD